MGPRTHHHHLDMERKEGHPLGSFGAFRGMDHLLFHVLASVANDFFGPLHPSPRVLRPLRQLLFTCRLVCRTWRDFLDGDLFDRSFARPALQHLAERAVRCIPPQLSSEPYREVVARVNAWKIPAHTWTTSLWRQARAWADHPAHFPRWTGICYQWTPYNSVEGARIIKVDFLDIGALGSQAVGSYWSTDLVWDAEGRAPYPRPDALRRYETGAIRMDRTRITARVLGVREEDLLRGQPYGSSDSTARAYVYPLPPYSRFPRTPSPARLGKRRRRRPDWSSKRKRL